MCNNNELLMGGETRGTDNNPAKTIHHNDRIRKKQMETNRNYLVLGWSNPRAVQRMLYS